MSERRAVIALVPAMSAKPVADLMRALQRETQRSGLDSRSQLMALAARDRRTGETGVEEMQ